MKVNDAPWVGHASTRYQILQPPSDLEGVHHYPGLFIILDRQHRHLRPPERSASFRPRRRLAPVVRSENRIMKLKATWDVKRLNLRAQNYFLVLLKIVRINNPREVDHLAALERGMKRLNPHLCQSSAVITGGRLQTPRLILVILSEQMRGSVRLSNLQVLQTLSQSMPLQPRICSCMKEEVALWHQRIPQKSTRLARRCSSRMRNSRLNCIGSSIAGQVYQLHCLAQVA
mmetsp:Transcript_12957/g.24689  ORF Transcript_12957/g.24689 Transcript_12957/m.24689 type:complete len:230 (+) Transcript_12957:1363-2052(+)